VTTWRDLCKFDMCHDGRWDVRSPTGKYLLGKVDEWYEDNGWAGRDGAYENQSVARAFLLASKIPPADIGSNP